MSTSSKKFCIRFFLLCISTILCFYQSTVAQSGRRAVKKPVSAAQTSLPETKSGETENDTPPDGSSIRVTSLTIVGEVQHNAVYYNSNNIDSAFKELIRTLKPNTRAVSEITKGDGKTNYKEAKELAEKQTETYVLWLGFSLRNDNYANTYISSVQYALLSPKGAKVVTRGQIAPDHKGVLSPGGVMNIPGNRRRTATDLSQMKQSVREIAAILVRGGWIK